jgi:hypothetical protein
MARCHIYVSPGEQVTVGRRRSSFVPRLQNIDQLPTTLQVPWTCDGVAFVRVPEVGGENYPLLVLAADRIGILTRTWSFRVTADQVVARVEIGAYPPVVPDEKSCVIIARAGEIEAYEVYDDDQLSQRKIPDEKNWCGSLTNTAGATELVQTLRTSSALNARLNDLGRSIIERRLGAA